MPDAPWVMTQTWHDLLFAHWQIDAAVLRSMIPPPFELDLFENEAWLGVVPFTMTNVGPRGVPSLPWISTFPELNVRTYVRVADRPGVYFFSLDAGSALAVAAARAFLNLPYFTATMTVGRIHDGVDYRSVRKAHPATEFIATYRPHGAPFTAAPGSLEYFLTERYCLYHVSRRGTPYRLDIHHPPWSIQLASTEIESNTMAAASNLEIGKTPALLHFARRQDTVAWAPVRLHQPKG
jgi:uncharacterized protein YqjF (DUF2071 family)